MRSQHENGRTRSSRPLSTDPSAEQAPLPRSEDLLVRSYDHRWAYDLAVVVNALDGEQVFEADYFLQPGQIESETDVLPHDEYEVTVSVDNHRKAVEHCRIGPTPEHTIVIEVGNGAMSLTEGLYE